MIGKVFTKLTVLSEADYHPKRRYVVYNCSCACGKKLQVSKNSLVSNRVKSCGCFSRGASRITHGSSTKKSITYREYTVWKAMKRRCYLKSDKHYDDYHGRGIAVCKRWFNSFSNFIKDMGPCPKGFSLDRIDNDGNYTPKNCRWSDKYTQARNKRNVRILTINGITKPGFIWAKENGITQKAYRNRIYNGWTIQEAVSIKLGGRR